MLIPRVMGFPLFYDFKIKNDWKWYILSKPIYNNKFVKRELDKAQILHVFSCKVE